MHDGALDGASEIRRAPLNSRVAPRAVCTRRGNDRRRSGDAKARADALLPCLRTEVDQSTRPCERRRDERASEDHRACEHSDARAVGSRCPGHGPKRQAALEHPADADIVIGVPDSAIPAAIGYAQQSGLPYTEGLVKNRYIGRTFIQPDQSLRARVGLLVRGGAVCEGRLCPP